MNKNGHPTKIQRTFVVYNDDVTKRDVISRCFFFCRNLQIIFRRVFLSVFIIENEEILRTIKLPIATQRHYSRSGLWNNGTILLCFYQWINIYISHYSSDRPHTNTRLSHPYLIFVFFTQGYRYCALHDNTKNIFSTVCISGTHLCTYVQHDNNKT